mgnify:CR=1 FL=1
MNSNLFSLNLRDVWKSALGAVIGVLLVTLGGWMQVPGFDFATADWVGLLQLAFTTFIGVLGQRFTTSADGKFLGKI